MPFLVLTGPTGVGKTTVQEELRRLGLVTALSTFTTRYSDEQESDIVTVTKSQFIEAVLAGDLIAPIHFATDYYAWSAEQFRLCQSERWGSVTVRPYTALMIEAMVTGSMAIYLDASTEVLALRKANRMQTRDISEDRWVRESADEAECQLYRPLFAHIVESDNRAVAKIIQLVEEWRNDAS